MRRYTVQSLTAELQQLVSTRYPQIEVEGEVSQVAVPASGHAYLTLRDQDAVLGCVAWRDTWSRQDYRPERGARVVCRGRMGVFGGKGAYQLYVHHIAPAGEGALAAEIARRKARLEADGLLDPRRKRPLPPFPAVVGVATSLTGAALQDFLKVTGERHPATRILVAGCQVQGVNAAASVVQAVDLLLEDGRSEVIVVTRGGGSKEDMLAFQDEGLCRFLANCPVPVVSAVGHEVDTSLTDLVADVVAPTPSAAAVAVLPDGEALAQRVDGAALALEAVVARRIARARQVVDAAQARLRDPRQRLIEVRRRAVELERRMAAAMQRRLPEAQARLVRAEERLGSAAQRGIADRRARVERWMERGEALSPQRVLGRGYAVVIGPGGAVTHATDVAPGDALVVRMQDGGIRATVDETDR